MTDASAAPPRAFATPTIRWAHDCRVPTSAALNVSRTVILRFSTRRRGRSVNVVSTTNRASVRVSFMRLRREYTGVAGDVKLASRCAQSNRKGTHEPRALLLHGDRAGASHPRARGVRHRGRPGAPGADRAGQPEGERDRHAHRGTCPRRGAREGRGPRAGRRRGAPLRLARRAQGPGAHPRDPDDVRLTDLPRPHPRPGRAARRTAAGGRRDHLRQDQHARVRRGLARRSPIAIAEPGDRFRGDLGRDFKGVRIAWSRDLGGLPVDRRVTKVLDGQRATFEALGCHVEDGEPDFTDARHVFQVQRALSFSARYGPLLAQHRHQMKDTVIWNTEEGLQLTAREIGEAEVQRARLYHRVREFMERHEFLLIPAAQVPPFDVSQPYVTEINGTRLPTYIDWMRVCSDITVTGLPALSVPAGFTDDGLPVGLQIVGRHQDEWGVLQLAHAFERATGCHRRRPPVAD